MDDSPSTPPLESDRRNCEELRLLNRVSSLLLTGSTDHLRDSLRESLRLIANTIGSNQSWIFHARSDQPHVFDCALHYTPTGQSKEHDLTGIPRVQIEPMLAEMIQSPSLVVDVETIPAPLLILTEATSASSLFFLPLIAEPPIRGFCVFPLFHVESADHNPHVYQTVGHMIAQALRRIADKRQLQQTNAAAEQIQEAKEMFLSNISKNLRMPLTSIIGSSQALEAHLPAASKYAKVIQRAGQKLDRQFCSLIKLAELQSTAASKIKCERVEAATVLTELAEYYAERAAEKGLTFDVLIGECAGRERYRGNVQGIRYIVDEILDNAFRYTNDGRITLTAERCMNGLRIEVSDTGIGISDSHQQYLFDTFVGSFARSSANGEGLGIGLSLAHQFAEAIGAQIEFDSTQGAGSTFRLLLPFAKQHVSMFDSENKPSLVIADADASRGRITERLIRKQFKVRRVVQIDKADLTGADYAIVHPNAISALDFWADLADLLPEATVLLVDNKSDLNGLEKLKSRFVEMETPFALEDLIDALKCAANKAKTNGVSHQTTAA
jgi:signal transduction histidine kinase